MPNDETLGGTAVQEIVRLASKAESDTAIDIGGYKFTRRGLQRLDLDPQLPTAQLFSMLSGFAGLVQAEPAAKNCIVHVVAPQLVQAISPLRGTDHHQRATYASAECDRTIKGFMFNDFMSLDMMHIALQTCFDPALGQIQELRKFIASVKSTAEVGLADDGVSQTVQAKRGIAAIQAAPVNNPWMLAPFRTFAEVPQPLSPFVLRFNRDDQDPEAALFETGDASWQVAAVRSIVSYLEDLLPDWKVLG